MLEDIGMQIEQLSLKECWQRFVPMVQTFEVLLHELLHLFGLVSLVQQTPCMLDTALHRVEVLCSVYLLKKLLCHA